MPETRRPLASSVQRALYGAAQVTRIGWHTGHYLLGRRRMGPVTAPGHVPATDEFPPLDRALLTERFRALFAGEWAAIEQGLYKRPKETRTPPRPARLINQSRDYLRDTDAVARRKTRRAGRDVFASPHRGTYPGYYLQNFHYQTDGWLSEASAARYDMQVETLFTGSAGAMRRLALPIIGKALAGRDPATVRLLDLGAGGAPLLTDILDNWPRLAATAIDLSPAYLGLAQRRLSQYRHASVLKANAEETGLDTASADIIIAVYLFHELPPKARLRVAHEIGRLLKPGGTAIVLDTLQYGDEPGFDSLLENFPRAFHEPYYDSYGRTDLAQLFAPAGLKPVSDHIGFLSKASVFRHSA